MEPVKTIKYALGADITLEKIWQIADQTREENPQSRVQINVSRGQMDQEFVEFVITTR